METRNAKSKQNFCGVGEKSDDDEEEKLFEEYMVEMDDVVRDLNKEALVTDEVLCNYEQRVMSICLPRKYHVGSLDHYKSVAAIEIENKKQIKRQAKKLKLPFMRRLLHKYKADPAWME